MSTTFHAIQSLVCAGDFFVSKHGDRELADDAIILSHVITSVVSGIVVEDYPDNGRGACVLVLQYDLDRRPAHVLWGLRRGTIRPAVLITAYRPNEGQWTSDWMRRLK